MKRLFVAVVALALLPTVASASDRYRGHGGYYGRGGYGHYDRGHYDRGHYDRGHGRSSFDFSLGLSLGPTWSPGYYRPAYRPYYYAPPVYYREPYCAPAPVYAPPPRYYYDDDCDYYYRPSSSISFGYSRYYRR